MVPVQTLDSDPLRPIPDVRQRNHRLGAVLEKHHPHQDSRRLEQVAHCLQTVALHPEEPPDGHPVPDPAQDSPGHRNLRPGRHRHAPNHLLAAAGDCRLRLYWPLTTVHGQGTTLAPGS
jgi:hypothetical protein